MAGSNSTSPPPPPSSSVEVEDETHFPEGFAPLPDRSFKLITECTTRPDYVGMRLTPIPMQIKWLEEEDEDEDEDIVHILYSYGSEMEARHGTLVACSCEESAQEILNVQTLYEGLMHIVTPSRLASLYYPKKKIETAFLFYPMHLVTLQSFLKKKKNHENESICSSLCRDIVISMRYLYEEKKRFHGNLYNGICVDERGKVQFWKIARGTSDLSNKDFDDLCKILELMNVDKYSHLRNFYEFVRLRSLTFDIKSIIWVFNHPILWDYRMYHRFFVNLYYCGKYGLDNNKHFIDEFRKKNLCRFVEEAGKNDTFLEILEELEDSKKRISVYLYNVMTEYRSHVLPEDMLYLEDLINLMVKYHPLVTEDLYECCFAAFSQDFSCYLCPNAEAFLSDAIGV